MVDKPTVLLIHGLIGSLDYFDPETRLNNCDVRTCDLLGYGQYRHVPPEQLSMQNQVEHLLKHIQWLAIDKIWLIGHSMGAAITWLLADKCFANVAGIISVEGNFTIQDAFWSQSIAAQPVEAWTAEYEKICAHPSDWLKHCGIEPTETRLQMLPKLLDHQPASTIYAMAQALLTETSQPDYLQVVERVLSKKIPLHLIAGERSAGSWDIPIWVRTTAKSYNVVKGSGHLMMLEDPDGFASLINNIIKPVANRNPVTVLKKPTTPAAKPIKPPIPRPFPQKPSQRL